jgi:hypothetical protein
VRLVLIVIGFLALVLASCATIPTPQDANDAVLSLRIRELGMGRGHCPHLGRSCVATPTDSRDRRARHHLARIGEKTPPCGVPLKVAWKVQSSM